MSKVALWEVRNSRPVRLLESSIEFEKNLESWLEADPSMLQGGLEIVGRQVTLEAGRLDLLAIDPQGRLCAIEIKRGAVNRDTVAQALDYAACLSEIDAADLRERLAEYLSRHGKSIERVLADRHAPTALDNNERQILIFVVGVGAAQNLERVARYLSEFDVPISVVSYDAFATDDGRRILCREVTEPEVGVVRTRPGLPAPSLEDLFRQAEGNGIGVGFRAIVDAGRSLGLHARTYRHSVMFCPPTRKARGLFTVWAEPTNGKVQAWVGGAVFAEFYPFNEKQIAEKLGAEGWRELDEQGAASLASGLRELFEETQ